MTNFYSNVTLCVSEKLIKAEVSGHIREHLHVINIFIDVNSILYMLTNIHTKSRILLKVFNVFRSENLALYAVTVFIVSEKVQRNRNSETQKQKERRQKIQDSDRS